VGSGDRVGVDVGKAGRTVSHGVLDAVGGGVVGAACEQATNKIGKSKKRTLM
jgi:hypothetical protein